MAIPTPSITGLNGISRTHRVATMAAYAKRTTDLALSIAALFVLAVPICFVALLVKFTSKGPVLYWSNRVGRNNQLFRMPKFRSMRMGSPETASHLLAEPATYLTPVGRFLRVTSLDELPQIYSILAGDLSLVGPRPALHNQHDLISLRTERGIHELVPGLTGWAQIHGRDELSITAKVEFDSEYLRQRTYWLDIKIILLTVVRVLRRDGVSH